MDVGRSVHQVNAAICKSAKASTLNRADLSETDSTTQPKHWEYSVVHNFHLFGEELAVI